MTQPRGCTQPLLMCCSDDMFHDNETLDLIQEIKDVVRSNIEAFTFNFESTDNSEVIKNEVEKLTGIKCVLVKPDQEDTNIYNISIPQSSTVELSINIK